MSDRALYILRERGAVSLRSNRYGGGRVVNDLLFGSVDVAIDCARSATTAEEQLTSAAGGALSIDLDARRIVYFGSPPELAVPRLRRAFQLYIRRMIEARQGELPSWSVDWAHEGVCSVADAIGHSRAYLVGGRRWSDAPGNFDHLRPLEELARDPSGSCIVTLRGADGSVRDVAIRDGYLAAGASYFLHGEASLSTLVARETMGELPHERDVSSGAFVDLVERRLDLWTSQPNEWLAARLAAIWPGWMVLLQGDGFPEQIRASGRAVETLRSPPEDEIEEALRIAIRARCGDDQGEIAASYDRIGDRLYMSGWADEDPMKVEIERYGDGQRSREAWYAHTVEMVRRAVRGDRPRWRESVLLYERDPSAWETRYGSAT